MLWFVLAQRKFTVSNLITLAIGSFLGFMVRPYLFIIVVVSLIIFILLNSKWNLAIKVTVLFFIIMATLVLMPAMSNYGDTIHFSGSSSLGSYTVRQQNLMAIGSSIPVFTHNPHLVFLFLPYLFLANLFLPLGIGARNFIGAISSVENAVLLWWVVFFFFF